MYPIALALLALDLGQIFEYAQYLWWVWMFLVAWWIYGWVQEKLAFAPMAALVIAPILIYFLVIEYPIVGTIGYIGYVVVFGGILYLLPIVLGPAFYMLRKH